MNERIAIVSARQVPMAPGQFCAYDFENVLSVMLSAPILSAMADKTADRGYDRLIYVAMSYWELPRMIERTTGLRRRSGEALAYVFDSAHRYLERWTTRFPRPLRFVARLARHELRNLGAMSRIFVPTALLIEEQQSYLGVTHDYMPIGVDAVRFGSERQDRTIDVNAYGRQLKPLTDRLSDTLNVRDGSYRFHHTNHLASHTISDPERYRRLFWRTLADSRVALAYAHDATGDGDRFDCAFVGQRWYESIAAGCAIMGRKPPVPETDRQFDWPDALIELPDDLDEARVAILALVDDADRLSAISRRNHRAALARHDWRHRIDAMAEVLGIERDARFHEERSLAQA